MLLPGGCATVTEKELAEKGSHILTPPQNESLIPTTRRLECPPSLALKNIVWQQWRSPRPTSKSECNLSWFLSLRNPRHGQGMGVSLCPHSSHDTHGLDVCFKSQTSSLDWYHLLNRLGAVRPERSSMILCSQFNPQIRPQILRDPVSLGTLLP